VTTDRATWPLRVLVVDDDRDTADTFAALLKLWGYYPLVAYRSVDALQLSRDQQPDVVLLDIGLPGIDGFEVARRVRLQPGMARALLIAVTGHGQWGDHLFSRAAGIDLHLVKPVEPEELHGLLAGARARTESAGAPAGRANWLPCQGENAPGAGAPRPAVPELLRPAAAGV
jgi:DNA-binding response OmpR family regulator